jgi:hypothetical protein
MRARRPHLLRVGSEEREMVTTGTEPHLRVVCSALGTVAPQQPHPRFRYRLHHSYGCCSRCNQSTWATNRLLAHWIKAPTVYSGLCGARDGSNRQEAGAPTTGCSARCDTLCVSPAIVDTEPMGIPWEASSRHAGPLRGKRTRVPSRPGCLDVTRMSSVPVGATKAGRFDPHGVRRRPAVAAGK